LVGGAFFAAAFLAGGAAFFGGAVFAVAFLAGGAAFFGGAFLAGAFLAVTAAFFGGDDDFLTAFVVVARTGAFFGVAFFAGRADLDPTLAPGFFAAVTSTSSRTFHAVASARRARRPR
jgi:hypothetical protein